MAATGAARIRREWRLTGSRPSGVGRVGVEQAVPSAVGEFLVNGQELPGSGSNWDDAIVKAGLASG